VFKLFILLSAAALLCLLNTQTPVWFTVIVVVSWFVYAMELDHVFPKEKRK
jgi:hypothetical protein